MIRVYARPNGTIAHIWDGDYGEPEVGTILIVTFNENVYSEQYQHIANNIKSALWNGSSLLIDEVEYLSAAWIAQRNAELTISNQIAASAAQMAYRAQPVAFSLPYFKASSDEIWSAIEMGKPQVSSEEIDALHTAFSAKIQASQFWFSSHEYVRELWQIAFLQEHPLHATHGLKALDIISWYSFNVIASLTAFLGSVQS